ncbi:hypothetical protein NUW58_g8963 [Xylaria curta]|uniref:Uncharacterized protein n=1 Tax=Xylaria curta TaxID=42375 RepID=A0ACC1N2T3_9PEZI|nr:hypothetical protein NUW58_g8963 [Xylaria curta]
MSYPYDCRRSSENDLVPWLIWTIAIAFAYFETLVRCNDINLVQSQLQRMTELNKYIEEVSGQDPELVGFMLEGSLVLFNDIIVDMSEGNDPMINLLAKFNDPEASQCLIYQLRLLAVARLKGHSAQYQSWLDCSVDDFVNKTLLPVNREIDHMCVVLIHDILLSQANIVLDIAYLDRSDGTEVNVHRFPEEANRQDPSTLGPFIYLLYRPDHYDILYRDNQAHALPAPPVPAPLDIQINRVSPFSTNSSAYEGPVHALENSHFMDISPLAMIPGLASTSLSPFGSVSTWDSPSFASEVVSAPPPSQLSPPQQQPALHPVRFSKYNFPNLHSIPAESNSSHEPPFTTSTFKNSHFNTAHYNNLNFQPEMYQPDAEEEASSSGHSKSRGRKQSTENCPSIKKEK